MRIISLMLIMYLNIYSQDNFEGIITYDVEIELLNGFNSFGISKETYIKNLKKAGKIYDKMYFVYKEGNYIITPKLNSDFKQVYTHTTNKIYTIENSIVHTLDASIDIESKKGRTPNIELLPEQSLVNGIMCRIVKVTWQLGTYYYYFNNNYLNVNDKLFRNHFYDMWNEYLKISKSLPLKIVKKVNNLSITTFTANKIKHKQIDISLFKI